MYKAALNPVRQTGFQSKPQMRYLIMMLNLYPEKFKWVRDVLREHGSPARETPLHTYWEGPYNVSPKTPSYIYTGRKGSLEKKITKFADKLSNMGYTVWAEELKRINIDEQSAKEVAERG